MKLKGMDVSSFQEAINWNTVSKTDINFVILRCHQHYGIDECFVRNVKGCMAYDIPFGVYKYSYAESVEDAKKEAENVLKVLKGAGLDVLELPVFYDLEWEGQWNFENSKIEAIALAFLDEIEAAGYTPAIYCNVNWYLKKLTDGLKKYPAWIASYPFDDNGEVVERLKPDKCDIWQYSKNGTVDGVPGNVDLDIMYNDLRGVKKEEEPAVSSLPTADDILTLARSWLGLKESDGSHRPIIDLYNSYYPLARGVMLTYADSWCDAFISALFIFYDAVDLIGGTECGVEKHIAKFKAIGIWEEDGTVKPKPGWIACYNWDDSTQPNDGFADHIGIVESVDSVDMTITVIEGNMGDSHIVGRRTIYVGDGYIRGYAKPKYLVRSKEEVKIIDNASKEKKSVKEIAKEVLAGKWGNGTDRKYALEKAGYDYIKVQSKVNNLIIEEKAKEVIAGKWGNGSERKYALEKAGYNYEAVQKKVNELLK